MEGIYENVVLTGLEHLDGDENPSGLQEDALICVASDMDTIAAPAANPLTPGAVVDITDDHIMKAGKAPIAAYTMFEKSDFNSPLAGEQLSQVFQPAMTFFLPQPSANNAVTLSILKNARLIVLFKRTLGGDFAQIGTQGLYAKVKSGSVSFGMGPTGKPGVTFVVEATSTQAFYVYKGAIPAPAA